MRQEHDNILVASPGNGSPTRLEEKAARGAHVKTTDSEPTRRGGHDAHEDARSAPLGNDLKKSVISLGVWRFLCEMEPLSSISKVVLVLQKKV